MATTTSSVGYYPQRPDGSAPYQQQQATVAIGPPPPTVVVVQNNASYVGMIVLSCLVLWFCNCVFGLIAFVLALFAERNKMTDPNGAKKMGKTSMWVSIAGIIVTVILIIIIIIVNVVR